MVGRLSSVIPTSNSPVKAGLAAFPRYLLRIPYEREMEQIQLWRLHR